MEERNQDVVTAEAKAIKAYVDKTWGRHVNTELEVPLRDLFPKPEKKHLHSMWEKGAADVVVRRRDGSVLTIIEPGGGQHLRREQNTRDKKKFAICSQNGVGCLQMLNGVMTSLPKRQWRRFLGSYIWGNVKASETN